MVVTVVCGTVCAAGKRCQELRAVFCCVLGVSDLRAAAPNFAQRRHVVRACHRADSCRTFILLPTAPKDGVEGEKPRHQIGVLHIQPQLILTPAPRGHACVVDLVICGEKWLRRIHQLMDINRGVD